MCVHSLYCDSVALQSVGEFGSGNLRNAGVSDHIYLSVIVYLLQCLSEWSGGNFRLKTTFAARVVNWEIFFVVVDVFTLYYLYYLVLKTLLN